MKRNGSKTLVSFVTHFQSLEMKYCSSSNLCSQSSTILSVYRCSIRQDRILHTNTRKCVTHVTFNTVPNVKINQNPGAFMTERVRSELLLQCHKQCLQQPNRLCYKKHMQIIPSVNEETVCLISLTWGLRFGCVCMRSG